MKNIGKIYSRKRFVFSKLAKAERTESENERFVKKKYIKKQLLSTKRKKIIKILFLIVTFLLIMKLCFGYLEPVFEAMCEEKVKSLATIITNQQSTIVMNKYQYEQLYTTEKDANGNIVIIKSNIVPINNMISELTENIQKEFDDINDSKVKIALGSLSGIYFLSGAGPEIPIDVAVTGTVDTELKSEFVSQGINQTLHRVYVNFECNMKIVTHFRNYTKMITNQVVVAEHVIVGNIPGSYYNIEGVESNMDALNVVE